MTCFSSFNYPTGQPPTPTRTPTSATFDSFSFQTPKQDTSFFDSWSTPNPTVASPNLFRTPSHFVLTSAVKGPSTSSGHKRPLSGQDFDFDTASHIHPFSSDLNSLLPSADTSQCLPSPSEPPSALLAAGAFSSIGNSGLEFKPSTVRQDSNSMQTPPPTSSSASRRQVQQAQVAKVAKESTTNGSRKLSGCFAQTDFSCGEGPTSLVETTPQQFPSLQFSPEIFGFQTSGPATAPVYPQQKLIWDSTHSLDDTSTTFLSHNNMFEMIGNKPTDSFISEEPRSREAEAPISLSFCANEMENLGLEVQSRSIDARPLKASRPSRTSKHTPAAVNLGNNSVNPSLLFSSPGRLPTGSTFSSTQAKESLQPYAHQVRDARIEREIRSSRKAKRRRGPDEDSPAVAAALQTLREDCLPRSNRSITDNVMAQDLENRPRRESSPSSTGRGRRTPVRGSNQRTIRQESSVRQTRKQTSVAFVIDANGRAKAEAISATSTSQATSDVDMEEGVRSDESESEDSEDSAIQLPTSQIRRSTVPSERHNPNIQRRFAASSKSHSQKSSDASRFSTATTTNSVQRIKSKTLPSASGDVYIYDNDRAEVQSEGDSVVNLEEDRGDAQTELRKVLKQRSHNPATKEIRRGDSRLGTGSRSTLSSTRRATASSLTFDPAWMAGPSGSQDVYYDNSSTTITDPELTSPSTDHESQINERTRCICHVADGDNQAMVLWLVDYILSNPTLLTWTSKSCRKYLHISCIGLDSHKLPKVYHCVFCTGQTPKDRDGRVRVPAKVGSNTSNSALETRSKHRRR